MRRELDHNHGASPFFPKGKYCPRKCVVKVQSDQVIAHQKHNSKVPATASRTCSHLAHNVCQPCALIAGQNQPTRIDNSSSSRTDAKDHAHRYARESLASSFWLSRGDGNDSQNSAVAYGVSTSWVQYLRRERRLPAEASEANFGIPKNPSAQFLQTSPSCFIRRQTQRRRSRPISRAAFEAPSFALPAHKNGQAMPWPYSSRKSCGVTACATSKF